MSLPPLTRRRWRNWAGNQRTAGELARPRTVAELAALLRYAGAAGRQVTVVGSGHSFTSIARGADIQIALSGMAGAITRGPTPRTVRVPAGTTLRQLNRWLAAHQLALPNLGDIDAQTVGGAIATGTHGTGARFGGLASQVVELTLVGADGEVRRCSATEQPDLFAAATVGLGALGVVTEVTLRCVAAFVLHADERPVPLAQTLAEFDEYCADNEHVEFYWLPYTEATLVKRNNRAATDSRPMTRLRAWWENDVLQNVALGGVCKAGRAVPAAAPALARLMARAFTPVSYTNRSDRIFTTPRRVRFVELEYALPRAALPAAFAELRRIVARSPQRVLLPVEVRVGAGDDSWLSPAYQRNCAYLAIHQYVGAPYQGYFQAVERACAGLDGRPHWGKLHWRDAESLATAYPRFADFLAVRDRLDPGRVFGNPYLARVLGP
ncbi:FAD-binding protein [Natronosporangium hydrolyticum]|uniref:FAD-binding protein n=1 Tax=Natronosporangium hydrolyticum TaxID=2811111 RepID=A0A895YFS7_9ACTN|nr:D-arabinono-1,4-lactone oxidase [Natronosporangium hydrolyticum]QSB13396.1 FAD-binding protein [Natronosporangium hydrolyticum]